MNIGNITPNNFNLNSVGKDMQIEVYEQLIGQLQQENKQLKDNWSELKEYLTNRYNNGTESISYRDAFIEIRESMQALEMQQKLEKRE